MIKVFECRPIATFWLVATLVLLATLIVPVPPVEAAQVDPSPGSIFACRLVGSGEEGVGPFPGNAREVAFDDIWDFVVADDGTMYIADRGDSFPARLGAIVKVTPDGTASVVVAEGGTVAGRILEEPFDLEVTSDGDLWLTSNRFDLLARINADGTQDDLSGLLPPNTLIYGISVNDAGTAYVTTTDSLIRLDPDGTTTVLLRAGDVVDGVEIGAEIKLVEAGPGGAFVSGFASEFGLGLIPLFVTDSGQAKILAQENSHDYNYYEAALWYSSSLRPEKIMRLSDGGTPETVLTLTGLEIDGQPIGWVQGMQLVGDQIYMGARIGSFDGPSVILSIGPTAQCGTTGPVSCTVFDAIRARAAGVSDDASINAMAVDGAGVVYASWLQTDFSGGPTESTVTATQVDGATSVLLRTGDLIDGQPVNGVSSVAAATISGELFVGDVLGTNRVVRRDANGQWSTFLDTNSSVAGAAFTGVRSLAVGGNDVLVVGLLDSPDILILSTGGPGADWERAVRSDRIAFATRLAVARAGIAPTPSVYVYDPVRAVLDRIDGVTQVAEEVASPVGLFFEGEFASRFTDIALDGNDLLISLRTPKGDYVARLSPDGVFSTLVDPTMAMGAERTPLGLIGAIEVDVFGDIYISATATQRVVRLPASGDCSTPRPSLIQDAAAINCDEQLDVRDALLIVQYAVGARVPTYSCPLGDPASEINLTAADVSGDGQVDIADALLVAGCASGGINIACP